MKPIIVLMAVGLVSVSSAKADWFVYSDENNTPRVFGIAVNKDDVKMGVQLYCDPSIGQISITVETSQNFTDDDKYPSALMSFSYNHNEGTQEFLVDVSPIRTPSRILAYTAKLNPEKTKILAKGLRGLRKITTKLTGHNIDEPQMLQSETLKIYSSGTIGLLGYLNEYCQIKAK